MNKSTLLEIADRKNKILSADQKSQQLALREQKQGARYLLPDAPARKKKRSTILEIADRKNKILSADQNSQQLALREQMQVARCLLPDAPPRKQKRKMSPTRTPCPLIAGTPLIPPPRKLRSWEVLSTNTGSTNPSSSTACSSRVEDEHEAVPSTVEELESVVAKTSPTKSSKLPFSATDGIPTIDEMALNTVVNADIQLIGFTSSEIKSSTNPSSSTACSSRVDDEHEAVPSTVEELESVVAKTSPMKSSKLPFSATDGIPTIDEMALNTVVNADIQLIGFTSSEIKSSTNPSSSTACSSRVDDEHEAVPSTVEELESVVAKTSPMKSCKLLFSATDGIPTIDEMALNTVVNADIQLIGFTPSENKASSTRHSVASVSPAGSTSSVTNISDDIEDQITEWEQNVGVNPGSDVDEDLADPDYVDIRVPRKRNIEEYPTDLCDLSSHHLQLLDEIDARDDTALRELVSSEDTLHFPWSSDPNIFTGKREQFSGPSGPTFSTEGMTPLDIFEKIWDEALINLIITETNRYASQLINDTTLLQYARLKRWSAINKSDLWTFFAVVMLQSFVPYPVEQEYWYPQLPYMRIGNFHNIMPHGKFTLIKRCLHFVDNTSVHDTRSREHSKLYKIMPILDHLNCKFSGLYLPEQNIAIDESLLLWKGKLSFSQLIKNKAARVGIKSYELCESRTGYLWKMEVYAGKSQQFSEEHDVERFNVNEGATSQIVYRLIRPLLNKGYTLTMDNFYNSPLLSRTLKSKKTDTIGTLRLNRQFVPDSLKNKTKANMRQGELAYSQTQDLSVVVWRDNSLVSLISTYHKVEVSGTEKHGVYRYKPKVVLDYNLSMGGVDKKDQLLQAFPVERIRNTVWYKKLFRRLLNVSIHNAHIIFTHHKKMPQRQFRTILADEILKKYNPQAIPVPPAEVPKTGHFPVKTSSRTRCKLCAKRKIEARTVWSCDTCGVNLCILDCFKKYHTS